MTTEAFGVAFVRKCSFCFEKAELVVAYKKENNGCFAAVHHMCNWKHLKFLSVSKV